MRATRFAGRPLLELLLVPEPEVLATLRAQLRDWLAEVGAHTSELEDLVLACNEACANSIEHARVSPAPDALFVSGSVLVDSVVMLTVRDNGRWQLGPPAGRGRGLDLICSLADEVAIRRSDDGTEITLYRRLERSPAERSEDASTGPGVRGPSVITIPASNGRPETQPPSRDKQERA